MRARLVPVGVVGLSLGLAVFLLGWQPQVQGQKPEKGPQWEYQVVAFYPAASANDLSKAAGHHTEQLNKLAAQGWEYVGVVSSYANSVGVQRTSTLFTTFVAFKRPRK
jgi:hypothetical protein